MFGKIHSIIEAVDVDAVIAKSRTKERKSYVNYNRQKVRGGGFLL